VIGGLDTSDDEAIATLRETLARPRCDAGFAARVRLRRPGDTATYV
jgi:hypothetical protein